MTPAKGSTDMEKLIHDLKQIAWIGSFVAGVIIWAFTHFATVRYVDAKHDSVLKEMQEMKLIVRTTDARVWEMNGRKDPKPHGYTTQ